MSSLTFMIMVPDKTLAILKLNWASIFIKEEMLEGLMVKYAIS
ncbi:hypothetical protein ACFLTK_05895 [Chloroflexota bacterium]